MARWESSSAPFPPDYENEEFESWLARELPRVNDRTQWMAWYQLLCWTLDPVNGISRQRASMAFMQISRARAEGRDRDLGGPG